MTRAIRAAVVAVLLVLLAWPAPGSAQEAPPTGAAGATPAPPTPGGADQGGTATTDPATTDPATPDPATADPGTDVGPGADPGPGGADGEGSGTGDPGTADPPDPAADPATPDPTPADPAPTAPGSAGPRAAEPGQDVQSGPSAPGAARQAAQLQLSRTAALPGETVTVTATGAGCADGRMALVWDGRDVADLVRGARGAEGVLTVPADAAPGLHAVEAWCVVGDWRQPLAAAPLTVLDPQPAAPAPPPDDPQPAVAAPAPAPAPPAPAPASPAARPRRDTTTLRLLEPSPAHPPEPVGTFGPVARSVFARTLPTLGAAFAPSPRLLVDAAATLAIVALLALVAARTRRSARPAPGVVDPATVTGPGWRWPAPRHLPDGGPRAPLLAVALVAVVATLLYGLLDRVDERVAGASLAAAAGLLVALTVTTLAVVLPGALYAHAVPRERVALRVRPAGLVVAAVLVVGSLLAGFEPGAVHGVLAAAVVLDGRRLRPADAGRAVLLGMACLAAVTAVAWTWWSVAVAPLVDPETMTFPMMVADAALAATVVVGLQGLALGLLPLPGLDGARLAAWSRARWAAAAAPAVFLFVHVLVNPDPATVQRAGTASPTVLAALAVAAAALWAATRAAARLRTRRLA